MNQEILERATTWTQEQMKKNADRLPDWTAYLKALREFLHAPPSGHFKVPIEYEYAYLRAKGLSHGEACERMDIAAEEKPQAKKKPGGFFRKLF